MNDIDFDKIFDFDNVTWEDCDALHKEGISVIIENGRIKKFIKE